MKPIAVFVLVATVSVVTVAASAKTGTAAGNTDERMISQVAGPPAAAQTSKKTAAESEKAKKEDGKAKAQQHQHSP